MAVVYLGLGSNINRKSNLSAGLSILYRDFQSFQVSSVYESESVGFDGQAFYNCVVCVNTNLDLKSLAKKLRDIELEYGRKADSSKFSSRTLDIDILLYDSLVGVFEGIELPREEITRNAFVLLPLQEIAPDLRHPVSQTRFAELWHAYDKNHQKLIKIEFDWKPENLADTDNFANQL